MQIFTAKLPYMFRVSQHPSSGVLKTVPVATGRGHTTCTATPLQRGLIGTAFIYCKATLHVSGVTAPIIRITKNCNRNLRSPDQATLEASSCTTIMTCNGGCGYSF